MSKVKSAAAAAKVALLSPTLRPAEAAIIRAVVLAVLGALGVHFGAKV
jgi:hypothetical protein